MLSVRAGGYAVDSTGFVVRFPLLALLAGIVWFILTMLGLRSPNF